MQKEQLEQHRIVALKLYEEVKKEFGEELGELNDLNCLYKNILENKFVLAVTGEAKAGKSTFLNALLNENGLLPTGTLQTTSTIIDIKASKEKRVSVKFENGQTKSIKDIEETVDVDEVKEFLREIAALPNGYEDLPVTQLNSYVIDLLKKKQKFDVSSFAKWLHCKIERKEIVVGGRHEHSEAEFTKVCIDYVESNKEGDKIPREITLEYPLDADIEQIRLIDTPGVGASGDLGHKTREFINQASGAIMVHNITGSAEKDGVRNAYMLLPKRLKKNLFFVHTHKSKNTLQDIEDKLHKFKIDFQELNEERIFVVDSLTELLLNDIESKSLEEIEDMMDTNEDLELVCSKPLRRAKGDKYEFLNQLEEQSGMRSLRKALANFANTAHSHQLHNFVELLKEPFDVRLKKFQTMASDINECIEDPQTFAEKIDQTKKEMEIYEHSLNGFLNKIPNRFDLYNADSPFFWEFKALFDELEASFRSKNFLDFKPTKNSDTDAKSLMVAYSETQISNYNESFQCFVQKLKETINREIRVFNASIADQIQLSIPEVVLSSLWNTIEEDSTEIKSKKIMSKEKLGERAIKGASIGGGAGAFGGVLGAVIGGTVGALTALATQKWETVEYAELNPEIFWAFTCSSVYEEVENLRGNTAENIEIVIEQATEKYKLFISKELEERKRFLEDTLQEQNQNNTNINKLKSVNSKIEKLNGFVHTCNQMLGELTC